MNPERVTISFGDDKYKAPNYITVERKIGHAGSDRGYMTIMGIDSKGKKVKTKVKDFTITKYEGPPSEYWIGEFLKQNGLSQKSLSRKWKAEKVPSIQLDKLTEQDRRCLKNMKGCEFNDSEISQITLLSEFNDRPFKILSAHPDSNSLKLALVEDEKKTLEISVRVFKAYAHADIPPIPTKALSATIDRHCRALAPYENVVSLTREILRAKTPALAVFLSENPARFNLSGNLYIHFGLQDYGESLGEQFFRNELILFGMDPELFPFNDTILKINEARANKGDDKLHGAWAGEIIIEPGESGIISREVILEIMQIANKDSNPFYRVGGDWQKSTEDEFFGDYKKGPIKYHSNNLFRHLIGLGVMANDWFIAQPQEASQPA